MRRVLVGLLAVLIIIPVYCQQFPEGKGSDSASVHWGKTVAGVRVGLALEGLNYAAGQEVPLRIFIENHSAAVPVYSEPPVARVGFGNFKMVSIKVAVLDEDGPIRSLKQPTLRTSGGPLVCPASLEQGKPVEIQTQLSELGLVPTEEGRYKIVVIWSPYTTHGSECDASFTSRKRVPPPEADSRPFATVTSEPIYIHVTGNATSRYRMEMRSNYDGWKSKLRLVNTKFGEKTALEDVTTGLQWLHLDLTTRYSYEDILRNLKPGMQFEGWRLATVPELRRLFADFTGNPTGQSQDQQVGRKLQRVLGGPLFEITNPETGWHRIDTRAWLDKPMGMDNHMIHYHHGYIGEDTGPLVTITPESEGSSIANYGSNSMGSFLVREKKRESWFKRLFRWW